MTLRRPFIVLTPLLVMVFALRVSSAWADQTTAPLPPAATSPAPTSAPTPAPPTALERAGRIGSDSLKPYVVLTEFSLWDSGHYGADRALRGAEAEATVGGLTEALKFLAHEKRPNGANYQSFPSGHASAAFSSATLLDAYRPHYKAYGYAWATGISLSRVAVHAHYLHDVAVGALLGHYVTRWFTDRYRNDAASGTDASSGASSVPAAGAGPGRLGFTSFGLAAYPDTRWHAELSGAGLTFGRGF